MYHCCHQQWENKQERHIHIYIFTDSKNQFSILHCTQLCKTAKFSMKFSHVTAAHMQFNSQ